MFQRKISQKFDLKSDPKQQQKRELQGRGNLVVNILIFDKFCCVSVMEDQADDWRPKKADF